MFNQVSKTSSYFTNKKASNTIYALTLMFAFLLVIMHDEIEPVVALTKIGFGAISLSVAEIFSQRLGAVIEGGKRLNKEEKREIYTEGLIIAYISLIPFVFTFFAIFKIITLDTALGLALNAYELLLIFFGYTASRIRGNSRAKSLFFGILIAVFAVIIVEIKNYFTH